jgi:hypothetical protein
MKPYGHDIHLILTNDLRRATVKLHKEIGDEIPDRIKNTMNAFTIYGEGKFDVHIFLEMNPDIGTIAHESFHAVDFVLRDSGIKNEERVSEEVWAYHLGELVRFIIKFFSQINGMDANGKKSTKKRKTT